MAGECVNTELEQSQFPLGQKVQSKQKLMPKQLNGCQFYRNRTVVRQIDTI